MHISNNIDFKYSLFFYLNINVSVYNFKKYFVLDSTF